MMSRDEKERECVRTLLYVHAPFGTALHFLFFNPSHGSKVEQLLSALLKEHDASPLHCLGDFEAQSSWIQHRCYRRRRQR